MRHLLAGLLAVAALVRAGLDYLATSGADVAFSFAKIGAVWAGVHRNSLQQIQPGIERYLAEWLWDPVMLTILVQPMAPVLAGLAVVVWLLPLLWRRGRTVEG
ncbi:MAG: hypothetical protein AAGE18_09590 [Pseudomonadota bacterium]